MKTKLLMTASALFMAALGLGATFAPHEIITWLGGSAAGVLPIIVQLGGGLYLGFAMLNWMMKTTTIGGIYGRPLSMGNLLHFLIGALALIKGVTAGQTSPAIYAITAGYSLFALSFIALAFGSSPKAA